MRRAEDRAPYPRYLNGYTNNPNAVDANRSRLFNSRMRRREFFTRILAGLAVARFNLTWAEQQSAAPFIERSRHGLPHKGKVLLAIQPHSDDIALICAGTV